MVAGPIPFTAIVEYSRIYGIEDFEEFLYIIRRLDNKFLELDSKKASSGGSSNTGKNNNSKGGRQK